MTSSADKHHYYPLFLDITGKECVIIGGGSVAERKAAMLLKFNARITVISPEVTQRLLSMAQKGLIEIRRRPYRKGDLRNAAMVFACTDDRLTNGKVRRHASLERIPVNVVDKPEECDFIVPSVIRKGDITIAISTSGVLPMASKKIRQAIETTVTKDHVAYTRIIGSLRRHLMKTVPDKTARRLIMRSVAAMDVADVVAKGLRGMKDLARGLVP